MPSRPPKTRLALLILAASLTGCTPPGDYSKAIANFKDASTVLTGAFQSLVLNANAVEADNYIDRQVSAAQPILPAEIDKRAIVSPDQVKLRVDAIQALSDYICALAALASDEPQDKLQTDTNAASASLGALAADIPHFPSAAITPLSTAASAIGDILKLIEQQRARREVEASIRDNDPKLTELFALLAKESRELYRAQGAGLSQRSRILANDYEAARRSPSHTPAELLEIADRIKQNRRDRAALEGADPTPAIAAFQKAHDELVAAILAPKSEQRQSFASALASAKAFEAAVLPLAQNASAFAKSL